MNRFIELSNQAGPFLTIELTNLCNYRCIMCYREKVDIKSRGFMDFSLFKETVEHIEKSGFKFFGLKLSWLGEPLMHPEIEKILKTLLNKTFFQNLVIDTNVSYLSESVTDILSCFSVPVFVFLSIDGSTKEIYEKIRVGGDFDNIEKNIKYICQNKCSNVFLRFQYILMDENIDYTQHFIEWVTKIAGKLNIFFEEQTVLKDNYIFFRKLIKPGFETECDFLWNEFRLKFESQNKSVEENKVKLKCCENLWSMPIIRFNGQVGMCNLDPEMSLCIGNINYENFTDIWLGDKAQKMRINHINGIYPDKCKNCRALKCNISAQIINDWAQLLKS